MKAFQQVEHCDTICCNCRSFEGDPEVGNMYGLCLVAKKRRRNSPEVVKKAYQLCDEETNQQTILL